MQPRLIFSLECQFHCLQSSLIALASATKTQVQGHTYLPFEFRVPSISPAPFQRLSLNFTQMFLLVRRCAELITRLCRLSRSRSWDLTTSSSPEPWERFSVKFTQMFFSVRQCAEPMTQLHRLKVKVTFQGHGIYP